MICLPPILVSVGSLQVGRLFWRQSNFRCSRDIKIHYCVIVYVGHFWHTNFSPISIWSLCYMPNSLIFALSFSPSSTVPVMYGGRSPYIFSVTWPRISRMWCANNGGGSCRWWKILRRCALKIILARDLLRQNEAWYWVPVRFPVIQGTEEVSSVDHVGVQHHDRNWDTAIDTYTYVWKGLLKFFRHELTQIPEYNECLIPEHSTHLEFKQRKCFRCSRKFLQCLSFFSFS